MPSIIRAIDQNRGIHCEAFNLGDMSVRADEYLAKIRIEAGKIVTEARKQADAIRQQAKEEGYQAALRAVEVIVRKELATVLPALRKAIEDIQHAKQAWLTHWETATVHTAAAIAQRLIRAKLPQLPDVSRTLLREALELAAGSSQLRIHINPGDHQALGTQAQLLVDELSGLAKAELIPDPEITAGGCRVETDWGIIDQQFETQLKRIEEELT